MEAQKFDNDTVQWATDEVSGWLSLKMRSGRYSFGLIIELVAHFLMRTYDVHAIYDEIGRLESGEESASTTKAAAPFRRPPLLGFWHKHHFQALFIVNNLMNEAMRKDEKNSNKSYIDLAFDKFLDRKIVDSVNEIAYKIAIEGLATRMSERRATG